MKTTGPVRRVATIADIEAIEQGDFDELVPARNLYDLFVATAGLHGDRPALTVMRSADPADREPTLTHREFLFEINRAANLFRSLGIGPGQGVVAILCPSLPAIPAALIGAQVAGTASTINYVLNEDAIADLLNAQGATVLLVPSEGADAACWGKVTHVIENVPSLQTVLVIGGDDDPASKMQGYEAALVRQPGDRLLFAPSSDRSLICALFHTGGTTGRPKVVQLTHGNQIYAAWGFGQVFGYSETDTAINGFPLFHVGGTMTVGLAIWAAGGHVVIPSPYALRIPAVIENYWDIVTAFHATIVSGVPTSIASMANVPVGERDLSFVRMAVTGGAVCPGSVSERFQSATGIRLFETYGMTETAAAIAYNPGYGEPVAGSVGFRPPFSQTRIVSLAASDAIEVCPPLVSGLVQVRGPQVFPGYLDPAHNAGTLSPDGWLSTGDVGYLTEDQRLVLTGRAKDLIVRSGHNIDPAAIEDVANAFPGVQMSAAVGMPDQYAGEVPILFVVPLPGAKLDLEALRGYVETHVHEPPAKPRRIVQIDALPVTAVGKIFKPALRDLAIEEKVRMEVASTCGTDTKIDVAVTKGEKLNTVVTVSLSGASAGSLQKLAEVLRPLPETYDLRSVENQESAMVALEFDGPVATLTLNRPDRLNVLSSAMIVELDRRLDEVAANPEVRVLIVTGAGRAFCAGGDLLEFEQLLQLGRAALLTQLAANQRVLTKLEHLPLPVIAAVNGTAVAGGFELMLCCDFAIAAKGAQIGDGHSRYGVVPAGGATARLLRRVSPGRAMQLFFTGELVDSSVLANWGLLNEVVAPEALLSRARAIAEEICCRSPEAIRQTKELVLKAIGARTTDLDAELEAFSRHLDGTDFVEGLSAFREKRRPDFDHGSSP